MHDGPPPANWPDGVTFLHKSRRSPSVPRAHLPLIPACAPSTHPAHLRIRQITDIGHPANGQYGLFTSKKIPPGTLILPYLGLIHGPSERHAESDYDLSLVRLGPVHPLNPTPGTAVELAIDADEMGNAARMVNDYRGTGSKVNAEFRVVNGRMELWSLAGGVPKGEILVSYGKGFWQARNA